MGLDISFCYHIIFIILFCQPVLVVPSFAQRVASEPNTGVDNTKQPAQFYWELMENQPDHMPGYNDPLIVDDTQGDFGGNPIIRPDRELSIVNSRLTQFFQLKVY